MGLILNLRYEKMNQVVLKAGLQSAVGQWNEFGLVDYAVAESTLIPKSSPGLNLAFTNSLNFICLCTINLSYQN